MHETRFVHEIITALSRTIKADDAGRKITAHVQLSPFSHVSPDGLREAFAVHLAATPYKHAVLDIVPLAYELNCRGCKRISSHTQVIFNCPSCGSSDFDINKEREFALVSLEMH